MSDVTRGGTGNASCLADAPWRTDESVPSWATGVRLPAKFVIPMYS
jgi:hypothetical protein